MAKKPVFTGVLQVAVVVKDLEASMKQYWEEYGIGPWAIYTFNPDTVSDMIIRDEREDYAMKLALTNVGDVQWELIQPLDEKSIYAEFLEEHGEGLHHVALGVEDHDKTVSLCRGKDVGILQAGIWHGFQYTYLDTEDQLSVIAEIYNQPEGFEMPTPEATYP
jgi:methylmalonyl-CoA/ethylmalonyl-CoA epimerase